MADTCYLRVETQLLLLVLSLLAFSAAVLETEVKHNSFLTPSCFFFFFFTLSCSPAPSPHGYGNTHIIKPSIFAAAHHGNSHVIINRIIISVKEQARLSQQNHIQHVIERDFRHKQYT
jgi:hypothetical protein